MGSIAAKMSSVCFLSILITLIILCKTSESERIQFKCPDKNFTFIRPAGEPVNDYCDNNICVAKCCPEGEILFGPTKCQKDNRTFDYSRFTIFKNDIETKIQVSEKNLTKDFMLVYNAKFINKSCSAHLSANTTTNNLYITEDGAAVREMPNHLYRWASRHEKLEYCIEIFISRTKIPKYVYHFLDPLEEPSSKEDRGESETIIVYGMLISAFFLLVTFVIHCLLPGLRNINGMMHMAYVGGLMTMFILKAVLHFSNKLNVCYYVVPLYYFVMLSNFLWLATMSFNIWWTFRSAILHRKLHRRGELFKFLVYFLSVYGTVGALTIFATVVDRTNLKHLPAFVQPHFATCLTSLYENILYIYTPIAILILINSALFLMTLYNIWTVNKGMQKFDNNETRRNQGAVCSFKVYVKLSFMMGVSWIIEVAQMFNTLDYWPYIIVNMTNSLIGVIIFILLITEKKTLRMLCKRFDIQPKWVQESHKTSTTFSGRSRSDKKSDKMETVELSKIEETTDTDAPQCN